MNDMLNNRELAVLIWSCILFFGLSQNTKIWEAIKKVISTLLHPTLLISFLFMTTYVIWEAILLKNLALWDVGQLKNSAKWLLFVASVELFTAHTVTKGNGYFIGVIKRNFSLLVIFEFIVAFQPFSFFAELILIPSLAFLSILLAVSASKSEYKSVELLLSWVLSIVGLSMVFYGIFYVVDNFDSIDKATKAMDLLTPILLSFLFLPFIFSFAVYVLYESILTRIPIYTDNNKIRWYAKLRAITFFKTNHDKLNEWLAYACISDFENKEAVDKSLSSFNQTR